MQSALRVQAFNLEVQANLIRSRRTKDELAATLGVSRPQLYARLRGEVDWRLDELWAAAELFGTPLADLIATAERQAAESVPA